MVQLTEPQTVVPGWSSVAWLSGLPCDLSSPRRVDRHQCLSLTIAHSSERRTRDGFPACVGGKDVVGSEPVGRERRRGIDEGGQGEWMSGGVTVPWPTGRGDDGRGRVVGGL